MRLSPLVVFLIIFDVWGCAFGVRLIKKVGKGVRWMPRLLQAMKDVISCDKPWVGANNP